MLHNSRIIPAAIGLPQKPLDNLTGDILDSVSWLVY
jgi:hypothetical protein